LKRLIDILGASVLLLLLFPVFLAVGILIKVVSRGPIFFQQERLGYRGRPFTLWKFRTMITSADTKLHESHLHKLIHSDTAMEKLDDADARLIPFGRFLRELGLDELPQLINVLRGK
jgi:lipopolysaccharide/colanic/teichoic acid biosynthesis glycosyltransferase